MPTVACVGTSQSAAWSPRLCELPPERIGVDVVGERPLAVDLDDREPLAVPGLELRVAADVDLLVVERELRTGGLDHAPRGGTEVAPLRVVEDDLRYG